MEHDDPYDLAHRAGNLRLVANTRLLIEKLVTCTATDEAFARAADLVADAASLIDGVSRTREYQVPDDFPLPGPWDTVAGDLHPLAPPIALELERREPTNVLVGVATYGFAYEGVPGCVHGGFVANAFDELLGLASWTSGLIRMTGQLQITYRSPVPIRTEVRYTAWTDRVEGRKAFVMGALHAGDVLCAEATGLFIAPREGRLEAFYEQRGRRQDVG